MKLRKQVLDQMERCYCTSYVHHNDEVVLLLASEAVNGPCYAYRGKNFSQKEVVWEHGGGTMSIVEIPHSNGEFLAVQGFFPGFQAQEAKIVHGKYTDSGWVVNDVMSLPYVHRFDLLENDDGVYFVGCILCNSKTEREDWSDPGRIVVGKIPENLEDGIELKSIKEGLTKNHGYTRHVKNGKQVGVITSEEGIFVVAPPYNGNEWQVEHISKQATSDVTIFDLDQDGKEEYVCIEAFHGNRIAIYKEEDLKQAIYEVSHDIAFAHALWSGDVNNTPTLIAGVRKQSADLFSIQYDGKSYQTTIIETGVGPANVCMVAVDGKHILVSANHARHEAAIYYVEDTIC